MSVQEFRTAVEGQLYILNNATTESQVLSALTTLINIRNRIVDYKNNRYDMLMNRIDNIMNDYTKTLTFIEVKPIYKYEQPKSIDDKIDDAIDSVCNTNTIAVFTGIALSAFYSYAYYMWFNGY